MRRRLRSATIAAAVVMAAVGSAAAIASERLVLPAGQLLQATHIHGLAVDRDDPVRLLVATHHGLYAIGEDRVARQLSERRDDLMGFTAHPHEAGMLYSSGHPAEGGNLGFMASGDGGHVWKRLADGVDGPVDFHQMDVSKTDPDVIYGVYRGLQASRDGGRSWERIGTPPPRLIDLAVGASSPDLLFAATESGLQISRDGGRTWSEAQPRGRPVTLVESTAEGRLFAFVVGLGLIAADEETLDWQPVSTDFGDRALLHLAIDPTDGRRMFAATHHGEILRSDDGGGAWRMFASP